MPFLPDFPSAATRARAALSTLPGSVQGLLPSAANPARSDAPTSPPLSSERLARQLILPRADASDEETTCAYHQSKGQFLARQDRWDDLSDLIQTHDRNRATTPCSMPLAELLCIGARADVVLASEEAILDGANPSLDGIEALEEVRCEFPDDYSIAVIVALAHADIGWAWRGTGWPHEIPERNLKLFHAHFQRAEQILNGFQKSDYDAPMLAAAHCALIAAHERSNVRVADEYEALINLNPQNPRPMRAMGNHLLPRWFGSYDELELEARRTAARTGNVWGNGAYAWVFMDALAIDPGCARIVDIDFFTDGMRDILSYRRDQHLANVLAAYAAITMDPERTPAEAPDLIRETRQKINATLDWILAEHLYELHPLVWAQAAMGPAQNTILPAREALIRRGDKTARQTIARHFEAELSAGTTVAFSKHGLRLYPAM